MKKMIRVLIVALLLLAITPVNTFAQGQAEPYRAPVNTCPKCGKGSYRIYSEKRNQETVHRTCIHGKNGYDVYLVYNLYQYGLCSSCGYRKVIINNERYEDLIRCEGY